MNCPYSFTPHVLDIHILTFPLHTLFKYLLPMSKHITISSIPITHFLLHLIPSFEHTPQSINLTLWKSFLGFYSSWMSFPPTFHLPNCLLMVPEPHDPDLPAAFGVNGKTVSACRCVFDPISWSWIEEKEECFQRRHAVNVTEGWKIDKVQLR